MKTENTPKKDPYSDITNKFLALNEFIQLLHKARSLLPEDESIKKIKDMMRDAKDLYEKTVGGGVPQNPQEINKPQNKKSNVDATAQPTPQEGEQDCGCNIAIQVVMLPHQTNQFGTIFGGIILSYIDQAAFVEASKHGVHRWVTASVDKVDFRKPIYVGDIVRFSTRTVKTGTKSVTIEVSVEAQRADTQELLEVTHATVTMVSVGPDGRPIPFSSPPTAHYRGL